MSRWPTLLVGTILCAVTAATQALEDDRGRVWAQETPARRIVALTPHLAELVHAAGAGSALVGVVEHADYPPAVRELPSVGNAFQLDIERLLQLSPDLVLVWGTGTPADSIRLLRRAGLPAFIMDDRGLHDIPRQIAVIGRLAGTSAVARKAGEQFSDELERLTERYASRPMLSVFYQVEPGSLFTLNGRHTISEVIRLCGGRNIFAALALTAPQVSREAVIIADPEVILGAAAGPNARALLQADWSGWPQMRAVRDGNVIPVRPDTLARSTPRLLQGVTEVCEALDGARQRINRRG